MAPSAPHVDGPALALRATDAYQARRFQEAGDDFLAAALAGADPASNLYNAACCLALAGDPGRALEILGQAAEAGYADPRHLDEDPDLDSLRPHPRWAEVRDRVERGARTRELRWETPAFDSPYQPDLSEDVKIAGLSRLWAEVRYNFAWFELVPDLDWDRLYLEALPGVRASRSTAEYYRLLQRLCARLHDGHTRVIPPREVQEGLTHPALRTRLVQGRVLVLEVLDPALEALGAWAGLEIVAVDGQPVREHAEREVMPAQSASTRQDREARAYGDELLRGPAGEPVTVMFEEPGGTRRSVVLPRPGRDHPPAAARRPIHESRRLEGGELLVVLRGFTGDMADAFERELDQLAGVPALVLDLRENGGGEGRAAWRILSMLTDRPFLVPAWRTLDYQPVRRAWGQPERFAGGPAEEVAPHPDRRYLGKVALLTGAGTYSAAEDFSVSFDVMRRGPLVGEPTGGSTGQPLSFRLPGGGKAQVCARQDRYPDGRPFVGVGVQPTVLVTPTVADVRARRDPILEAALDVLRRMPER